MTASSHAVAQCLEPVRFDLADVSVEERGFDPRKERSIFTSNNYVIPISGSYILLPALEGASSIPAGKERSISPLTIM